MSFDTETKRRAILMEGLLPVPDGSIDPFDKPVFAWLSYHTALKQSDGYIFPAAPRVPEAARMDARLFTFTDILSGPGLKDSPTIKGIGGRVQVFFTETEEPDDPDHGTAVFWLSNGIGAPAGDWMMKITVGAVTKTITLIDYSAS